MNHAPIVLAGSSPRRRDGLQPTRACSTRGTRVVCCAGVLALVACRPAVQRPPLKGVGVPADQAPKPIEGHNLILNPGFVDGTKSLPWTASYSGTGDGRSFVRDGALCLEITNKGVNRWDAHLRHQHLLLQKGHAYQVQYKMYASQKTRGYTKVGQAGPPYKEYWHLLFELDQTPKVFFGTMTMTEADDPGVEIAFHLAGSLARQATPPFTVCVDDVHIDDPQYTPPPPVTAPPIPPVLVNQTGYYPGLVKLATVKAPGAVPWQLRDGKGAVVAAGSTLPYGLDRASGDQVSVADFSSFTGEGTGFTIAAAGGVSHPFDIRNDLYHQLKYDALSFFYQQRSGIALEMPYVGDPSLAHPAGHVNVPPNKGDKVVPCAPGSGCTYSLDVSGGWYDAGDQGKYVVNAGISVWTLLNFWERAQALGWSAGDFADGKMNIPENKNGVPDLLDEARWELEFELKMQVPEGEKLAGMAHHKIHDVKWAPDNMWPQDDPIERYLQPPSTGATLNLAANGAQCARVWRTIDKAFADKCLAAAERAWVAAKANPEIIAPAVGEGGGPYDDKYLLDDFYWAATELYLSTKKAEYREFLTASPHYKEVVADWDDNPGMKTSMTWGDTKALGSISIVTVPNDLPDADKEDIKRRLVARGDELLQVAEKEGYRLPFGVPAKGYPWGSTSFVLNNGLILAMAHTFSHDVKHLNGAVMAMDYVLGRNAIDQSYVTGYGERPLENPYHRFWSHQSDPRYPKAPPGVLSGGANSELQDPWAKGAGLMGCAPQKCFLDNSGAWSVNEVTINWNAPLVWLAAYLDEQATPRPPTPVAKPGPKAPAGAKAGKAAKPK